MKILNWLLFGSLTANAALLMLHFQSASPSKSTEGLRPALGTRSLVSARSTDTKDATTHPGVIQLAEAWRLVQTNDPRVLIARLRAAGLPTAMVRAIAGALVTEQFAARRKALLSAQEETPFWKIQRRPAIDFKFLAELRQIRRQEIKLTKDLLGSDDLEGQEEVSTFRRRIYGNLPREKLEPLETLVADYNELRSEIYSASNGIILPEDREKLALLEKEQRGDLANLLTPQEMEAYELRSSTTANWIRSQLGTFEPSEAEFRALFRAQRSIEERFGGEGGMILPGQMRERQTALLELMKSELPAERVTALEQAMDPNYSMVQRLVSRLELPRETVADVLALQKDIQQRARTVQVDFKLPASERTAKLAALADEATNKLTAALGGSRGLEAYKQYGGYWLQTIAPPKPNLPAR